MTVLSPNQCYNEVCYKGTALYMNVDCDQNLDLMRH